MRSIYLSSIVVSLSLLLTACPAPDRPTPDGERADRLEGELDRLREAIEETRTFVARPSGDADAGARQGQPFLVTDALLRQRAPGDPPAEPGDEAPCPVLDYEFAIVRAERGTNCATYAAEVPAFVALCTDTCDAAGCCERAVRLAAGTCAEFCQQKNCGQRITFVPPAACAEDDCFAQPEKCAEPCPKKQWCSLLSTKRMFNCFCRDLIVD